MTFDYINEAFKKLDLLEEQMFNTSLDGVNELSDFMDNDNTDDIIRVIDPEAETEEEIKDSYIGKVIINCNVCHSHIFENKEDIQLEEDGAVNVEMQCPYCGEQSGFKIVGEIAPYGKDVENDETDTSVETAIEDEVLEEGVLGAVGLGLAGRAASAAVDKVTSSLLDDVNNIDEDELLNEALGLGAGLALGGAAIGAGMVGSALLDDVNDNKQDEILTEDPDENKSLRMSNATRRLMKNKNSEDKLEEDFKEVSITTDDQHMEMTSDDAGKVTVITEPVNNNIEASEEEVIVPVSDETEEEILDTNEVEPDTQEDTSVEESELDLDFDEIDEEGFDDLGESYLRKVYENVESFKTTSVAANEHAVIVEGLIKFTSGTQKKTGFMFEAKDVNSKGQLRFKGSNKHISESADAFSLVGRVDNKKLFVESLKYNYTSNNTPVRGVVRRK